MGINFIHKFEDVVGLNNLLSAWQEFLRGKGNRQDIKIFSLNLMDNIFQLNQDLNNLTYQHGKYHAFNISDPKPRNIHKATVRDRLLHHAVYRILYPYFDKKFISNSHSCRLRKGTHKAMNKFRQNFYKVSKNNTRTCWVLKCDIKKFFASIDHDMLKNILKQYIDNEKIIWLLDKIIDSFHPGLPLGNLTSQLLVNVYMNKFDQFVKHKLKIKYYIRYADDFVFLHKNKNYLENLIPKIKSFLQKELKLEIHQNKIFIKTYASGIDFLGWINFSDHRILRTSTKRRMLKRIKVNSKFGTIQSYLGLLKHGNTFKLQNKILE